MSAGGPIMPQGSWEGVVTLSRALGLGAVLTGFIRHPRAKRSTFTHPKTRRPDRLLYWPQLPQPLRARSGFSAESLADAGHPQ